MIFTRKPLLEILNPFVQTKRLRGKINIQKPKPPHFVKATYLALTKPFFHNPKKNLPLIDLCTKASPTRKEEIENPFQKILAQEALGYFQSSKLIAFYHANPMNSIDHFKAFAAFHKEGMLMKGLGKKTLEMAIKGTPYEAVLDIYVSRNMIVFSSEPKIKQLLKISKRFPQLILMAGVYEGKFLHIDDLIKYSSIPNLETAQAMLAQNLKSSASKLHRQLNSHQTSLLALLNDRQKQISDSSE
ncbi:hypothetical protein WA026_006791 [Henosepilachna vigintioctopunctata]|uniref:Large ribosomal subunit protein uL10m n=1 Tax=Henosepilachna vigintioctopunctata TaxID=420089 RepID=A0AAW1U7Y5_9CUCU